ncbi:MAG: helicase [Cyanobacteriota bacterium]|nr:helicase [Cyanobacteriota bacterium]
MHEARAHQHLKQLLRSEGRTAWPHHLSLSRLVARSLRRSDHTLIRLVPGSDPSWWLGLLVPLALGDVPLALVASQTVRQRLLEVELPRLRGAGLGLPCVEGPDPPAGVALWLLSHQELIRLWRRGELGDRHLVIPEVELLDGQLRAALEVVIEPGHWDALCRAQPAAGPSLLELHERLSLRVLRHPGGGQRPVPISAEEEAPLRQLLALIPELPEPWPRWLEASSNWASWARLEKGLMQWRLHRQPLEPLDVLEELLSGRGAVLVGETAAEASGLGLQPAVDVCLGDPPLADPLPLFAPLRQPLPNSPNYGEHLLEQSRRLVLGMAGLTAVLLDDESLRRSLTAGLAAEFGSRVVHESTAPEQNGVVCASWDWWLQHQPRLPLPCQLVVALLPIASLEDPLTAARVENLRHQGRDWFRERLLPDGIGRLQRGLAGLRRHGRGRLAVLDGRLRSRAWGQQVLHALEPWVALKRLLPRDGDPTDAAA